LAPQVGIGLANAADRKAHDQRQSLKALFDVKYGWIDGLTVELRPA
jgi:hypothetical protein